MSVEAIYTTTNLFGDGQTAIVFQVTDVDEESVTFVLTGSKPGEYHVTTPYENWFVTYHAGETITVTDLNGNGQPEIQRMSWGRWDIFCGSGLAVYEWRGPYPGGAFVDLARNIPEIYVEGVDNFDCTESWHSGPVDANGAHSIVAVLDPYYGNKNLNCKDDALRATYLWNGLFYEWAGQSIDSTSNSHSLACAVLWANWAGGMSDEAISFMASALENWPTEIDGIYDSITPDNFRFKLGTWYALRGETLLAQNTLQMVRDYPVNTQSNRASQLAGIYLANYQSTGSSFTACDTTIRAYEAMLSEPDFLRSFNPQPYGICNLYIALQQTARTFQPQTTAELMDWFDEQRIAASTITTGDVNSDGRDDWLAHIKLHDSWSLWAFISSGDGLRAVFVAKHVGQGESLFATLTQVPAEIDLASINVFTLGGRSTAFQIIKRDGVLAAIPYPVTLLPPEYHQPLYDDEKLALAGKILFQSADNTQALTLLEELQDASTVDRGHVLYLLGLAHELAGHEPEAVQAYWQLWHDYPDNPYTLMARRKLEVITP